MRDFFIRSFEMLVGVIVVVMGIAVLIGAVGAMFGGNMMGTGGGILAGLAVLVIGGIYVVFMGGIMYLGLGIYQNTKRTAELLERSRAG